MEEHNQHIDKIIKEKFENFAPVPPESVWKGIEASLNASQTGGFFTGSVKWIFYGVAMVIILLAGWFLLNTGNRTPSNELKKTVIYGEKGTPSTLSGDKQNQNPQSSIKKEAVNKESGTVSNAINQPGFQPDETELQDKNAYSNNGTASKHIAGVSIGKPDRMFNYTSTLSKNGGQTIATGRKPELNNLYPLMLHSTILVSGNSNLLPLNPPVYYGKSNNKKESRWSAGIFISPEFTLNSVDSLKVLQAYSLNGEIQYKAENGLFFIFVTGAQYTRDRYFVNVRFKSWDYLGSYDDVYEVTFDTTSGTPVPIYHTNKVDVYDSILHLNISELTSRYLYLQFPLLAGYNGHLTGRWNWYVYGGPAINFMVWQSSDYPQIPENSNMVNYTSNIYKRNSVVYQFWMGAGFEYMLINNINFVLEPGFRYYFNPVYKDFYRKQSLSAFSLCFGLTFKL